MLLYPAIDKTGPEQLFQRLTGAEPPVSAKTINSANSLFDTPVLQWNPIPARRFPALDTVFGRLVRDLTELRNIINQIFKLKEKYKDSD